MIRDVTSAEVKGAAIELGADLCGIASMDRFEGAPFQMDPRYIFPEAKSMIVLAFRLLRGYFRGIEEGTYFAPYTSMGYGGTNHIYAPYVLRRLGCWLEDCGWEAVPIPNIVLGANLELHTQSCGNNSLAVREGWPKPDVLPDFRISAFLAGLGEIGYSRIFLTPEFGPMQRFVLMLTDAELEPDPIYKGGLCDRCMQCARMCGANCISTTEKCSAVIAGHTVEWGKFDWKTCSRAYMGATVEYNPFLKPDADLSKVPDTYHGILEEKLWEGTTSAYGQLDAETGILANMSTYASGYLGHNTPTEGARGCIRECYIHLEKTGKLTRKFHHPFRKRKPWVITPEMREKFIEESGHGVS